MPFFSPWCFGYWCGNQVLILFMDLDFWLTHVFVFRTLPYTLVSSTFSVISGFVVSRTGKNLPSIWFGCTLMTVGTGLLIMLDYTSTLYVFLLRNWLTVLSDSKCRTRGFSSDRGHRRRIFVSDSYIGTSSGNASEGYGYRYERVYVPSVRKHFSRSAR